MDCGSSAFGQYAGLAKSSVCKLFQLLTIKLQSAPLLRWFGVLARPMKQLVISCIADHCMLSIKRWAFVELIGFVVRSASSVVQTVLCVLDCGRCSVQLWPWQIYQYCICLVQGSRCSCGSVSLTIDMLYWQIVAACTVCTALVVSNGPSAMLLLYSTSWCTHILGHWNVL